MGLDLIVATPRAVVGGLLAVVLVGMTAGCTSGRGVALTEHVEARTVAADLRVQFSKAADAANQAVMADTDEASIAAAADARRAREAVEENIDRLQPILQTLGYSEEIRILTDFGKRFAEYKALDDDILDLAVENTNLKAQRLSFGDAQEAADAFGASLQDAGRLVPAKAADRADALVARATAAVLGIQVLQARHIAEADEARMSAFEAQMAASLAAARSEVEGLKRLAPPTSGPAIASAAAALDRFTAANTEIVRLSRRNTNVRSLALTLGRKRTLTAGCEELLREFGYVLGTHEFKATR